MARIPLPDGDAPEVVRALGLRPRLAQAVSALDAAVWNSTIDWRVHELVRMRIARINECTVCVGWRTPQAIEAGVTEELLDSVEQWATAPGFTAAERVALEYAERFATASAAIDDALVARLGEHFEPGELVELTLVIGKYLSMGKLMQVLDLDQTCSLQMAEPGRVTAL